MGVAKKWFISAYRGKSAVNENEAAAALKQAAN